MYEMSSRIGEHTAEGEIVPVDADGSSGVNKKKLRGETTRTWRAAP